MQPTPRCRLDGIYLLPGRNHHLVLSDVSGKKSLHHYIDLIAMRQGKSLIPEFPSGTTSSFGQHSLFGSVATVSAIVIAVGKPIAAKFADVLGRTEVRRFSG